jgi:ribonuclease III
MSNATTDGSSMPFNVKNRLLMPSELDSLLRRFGIDIPPNDVNIYRLALVHRSYCTRKNENFIEGNANNPGGGCVCLQECSNERLEFLGDSVLGMVVAAYLYERYPDHDEGFLTTMRARIVNGNMLARLSSKIGIGGMVLISKQIEDAGGRSSAKILEDTLEALIGAIYLDFGSKGIAVAKTFIINMIEGNIDFAELVSKNQNYKDVFLKFFMQQYNYAPKFNDMNVSAHTFGPGDKSCGVCIKTKDGGIVAIGRGVNKKAAELDASFNALKYFNVSTN